MSDPRMTSAPVYYSGFSLVINNANTHAHFKALEEATAAYKLACADPKNFAVWVRDESKWQQVPGLKWVSGGPSKRWRRK